MSASSIINVTELIDRRPVGALQVRIIVLCGLVALLDGFDVLSIGLAAPEMADTLHIAPNLFGTIFSAALLGLMLGAFALGPVADQIGRRRVLIGATAVFGIFTILTADAATLPQLLLFRFLAGFGLGGAMPSFISLAAEYTPRPRRGTVVALLYTGFPFGGMIVGLLGPRLIDTFGWPSLFYIGGVLPLVMCLLLVLLLPDSIGFLVAKGAASRDIRNLVTRIDPAVEIAADCEFVISEEKRMPGMPLWHLFKQGRTVGTLLLWFSYFVTFLILVTNVSWTPILFRQAGIDVAQSAAAIAIFSFGSVIGTPLAGFLVNRRTSSIVLPALFIGGALMLGAVGYGASSTAMAIVLQGFAGFFLGAGSSGIIALAALFYPTVIRSTGIGWAMGMGRFGSFVGPLYVGMLVEWGWDIGDTFAALAAPALCAALFTALIGAGRLHQDSDADVAIEAGP